MKNSYKKYVYNFIKKRLEVKNIKSFEGVSIITSTNKPHTLTNILENFNRQDYLEKELTIIINNDSINLEEWSNIAKKNRKVNIFKLNQKTSLGKCLNFAVDKCQYNIIAKFDDDDYYGPKYISSTIEYFKRTDAKVLGKAANFVYFVEKNILAIRTPNQENRYVRFANGSTLVFKKEIFEKVKFRDMSLAEDVYFCQDCVKNNILIYSTDRYHHVYFRHPIKKNHTWKITDDEFMDKYCKIIGKVEDYISYANNVK
ncbi:glycosyltransferase [Clostridium sp. Cult1]|uniref:glycosyltransferase n=1 Tax=Clostridium sp. Cult1 TaxID=2079002 RepID=UPI001F3DBB98|nr:glycosyltransferase family 2 protein [Clostridium sp. Cult1]MCF6464133.1 glycosyl transferase family 2 [Clostridium sp. Cult1]